MSDEDNFDTNDDNQIVSYINDKLANLNPEDIMDDPAGEAQKLINEHKDKVNKLINDHTDELKNMGLKYAEQYANQLKSSKYGNSLFSIGRSFINGM